MYALKEQENRRKKFSYSPSKKALFCTSHTSEGISILNYLCWERVSCVSFMTHQPGQSLFVVEAEKDACKSVFNRLREKCGIGFFWIPRESSMETYVLAQTDPIIVIPLISQSPHTTYNGIPFPNWRKSWWIFLWMKRYSSLSRAKNLSISI